MKFISKIRVVVIGLNFGGNFPPIYAKHPDVEYVGIYDKNKQLLRYYSNKYGFKAKHSSFDKILNSDEYNAVHIVTPIHTHAELTMKVLDSGKHCACTVPMGTTIKELKSIVEKQKQTGLNYMMMETGVFTRQYLYAKQLIKDGIIGRIQFLRGAHYQDMENWPSYWNGLPPMHYATHAICPLIMLTNSRATKVHCYGSGIMREELRRKYGNPYPIETAIYKLNDNFCAEVTRSLFHTARSYLESFNIYGEKASFEWHLEKEPPILFQLDKNSDKERMGRKIIYSKISLPNFHNLIPKEIVHFQSDDETIKSREGGAHQGSHPHMVHEFIRSIIEKRPPLVDSLTAANCTAAGICAHESAMKDGMEVIIPNFE